MAGTVQDFQTGKTNEIIKDFDRFHQMNNPIAFQNCRLEEQRRNYIDSEQRYGEHVQNFRNQPNNIFMKKECEGMYLEPESYGVNASFPNQHGLQQRDVPNTKPPLRCYQGKYQINDVHSRLIRSGSPPRRQEDIFVTQNPQATNSNSLSDNRFPSIYYNHSTTQDDYSLPSDYFDNSYCSPRSDLESGKASSKTVGNEIIFENSIQNGATFQIPGIGGSGSMVYGPQTADMASDNHRRPSYFDLPPAPPLPHRPPRDNSEDEESQYVSHILLQNSPDEKSSYRCADKRIVILGVLLGIVASVAIVAPLAMKFQARHTAFADIEQMPFTTAGPVTSSNINTMQRKTTTDGTTSYETSSTTSSTTENTSQTTVLTSSISTENTSPTTVLTSSASTENTSPTTVLTSSTENTSPTIVLTSTENTSSTTVLTSTENTSPTPLLTSSTSTENTSPTTVLTSSTENTSPSTTSSTIETTTITSTEQTTSPALSGTFGCHSCTCSDSRCPVDGNMKYTAKCGQVAFNCRIACFSQVRTSTRLTHRGCVDDKLDWAGHADWRGLDSGCHQLSGGYVCFCKGQYCNTHNLTSYQTNPAFGCIQTRTTEPHNCS